MNTGNFQTSMLALALALTAGAVQAGDCAPSADKAQKPDTAAAMPAPGQVYFYNPWSDLMRMEAALENPFGPFNSMNALWQPMMFAPPMAYPMPTRISTLQKTKDGYQLDIPLKGFKPEDIHVRLDGQLLTISAQTANSDTVKVGQQDEQSRSSRSFAETMTLPGPVQASQLKENFKDGVLTLTIPAQSSKTAGSV